MYCKSCGKKIPDGINYCPYCGTPVSPWAKKTNTSVPPPDQETSDNLQQNLNSKFKPINPYKALLDKWPKEKVLRLKPLSTISKITQLLCFFGVILFFASTSIFAIFSSEQSSTVASNFRLAWLILMIVYASILIIFNIINIVMMMKQKKDVVKWKNTLITKIVISCFHAILIVLTALNINNSPQNSFGLFTGEMFILGINFISSAISATASNSCIIPKYVIQEVLIKPNTELSDIKFKEK